MNLFIFELTIKIDYWAKAAEVLELARNVKLVIKEGNTPPTPAPWVTAPLQASVIGDVIIPALPDLDVYINTIADILPKMSSLAQRFIDVAVANDINTSIEANGKLYLDVYNTMPQEKVDKAELELGVIHDVLKQHQKTVLENIKEGLAKEKEIRLEHEISLNASQMNITTHQ